MGVTVERFDAAQASETELRAFHEVTSAWYADDRPRWTAPTYEEVLFRLRTPFQGLGPSHRWSARLDGEIAGFAELLVPDTWEDVALLEIVVHPRARRRGVGSAVLRALLPEIEARGRSEVEGFIPTGWYPTAVLFDETGRRLFVLSGKGLIGQANPRGPQAISPTADGQYAGQLLQGTVSVIDVPDAARLAAHTARVIELSAYTDATRLTPAGAPAASPRCARAMER